MNLNKCHLPTKLGVQHFRLVATCYYCELTKPKWDWFLPKLSLLSKWHSIVIFSLKLIISIVTILIFKRVPDKSNPNCETYYPYNPLGFKGRTKHARKALIPNCEIQSPWSRGSGTKVGEVWPYSKYVFLKLSNSFPFYLINTKCTIIMLMKPSS